MIGKDEHILLSEVLGAVDAYNMHKAKKGLTIKMQIIDKDKGCTSCGRESFRSAKAAVKFLEDKFVKCVEDEHDN